MHSLIEQAEEIVETTTSGTICKIVHPPLTEYGMAQRVLKRYPEILKYLKEPKRLVVWDGQRFGESRHIAEICVVEVAETLLTELACQGIHVFDDGEEVEHKDFVLASRKFRNPGPITKVLSAIRLLPGTHCSVLDFDSEKYIINCLNGLLNLETGEISPHSPSHLVTKIAPVYWRPDTPCPFWLDTINRISNDDIDLAAYLQRLMGYCLSGSTQEEVLPILHGNGANGKSVFLSAKRKVLGSGEYALSLGTGSILNSAFHGIRCDLRQLEGVRVAFAIEANQNAQLDEAVIKTITGGDEVSARALRRDPVQFVPQAKILMAVNHLPVLVGTDRGIRRRIQVVPFRHQFDGTVRKETIDAKIDSELSGIFAWAVEGFKEWQKQGLNPPACVVDATRAYFEENDHITAFMTEMTTKFIGAKTPMGLMYEAYQRWTKDAFEYAVGKVQFGKMLQSCGVRKSRINTTRVWEDITINNLNNM